MITIFYGPANLAPRFPSGFRVADILKMYPLPGWQMVIGEILAPAAILAESMGACPARVPPLSRELG